MEWAEAADCFRPGILCLSHILIKLYYIFTGISRSLKLSIY